MAGAQVSRGDDTPNELAIALAHPALPVPDDRRSDARLLLDDPESVLLVDQGQVTVFAVELHDAGTTGVRRFLWTTEAPGVVFGLPVAPGDRRFGLLAIGASGSRLRRVPLHAIRALSASPETTRAVIGAVEGFVVQASTAVDASALPAAEALAPGGASPDVDAVWDRFSRVRTQLSVGLGDHSRALETAERARLTRKADAELQMLDRGVRGLAGVVAHASGRAEAVADGEPLLAACRAVGARAGIVFQPPPGWEIGRRVRDPLASICRVSRVRQRRVALRGRWWRASNGPLLGFIAEGRRPVALLPVGHSRYEMLDPVSGHRVPVDAAVNASLDPFAFEFSRPSPDTPITLATLGRMALGQARGDLARLLLAALAGGLLGLVLPIATGKVFSEIIPMAVPANILPLLATLVAFTLASTFFDLTRAMALIRIEGRTNSVLQSTIIDRLLALPVPFFRAFSVGDLAMRASAVNAVRGLLSGAALTTLLEGAFSVVNLGLLFYYSSQLALVAIAAVIVSIAFTSGLAIATIRIERRRQAVEGAVAGLLFEMINGIAKLRVAGAESRAFAIWTRQFREQCALGYRSGTYENFVSVFNGMLPVVSTLALLATTGSLIARGTAVNTGDFVAFTAAYGAFFAAAVQLSDTFIQLLNIIPLMERAQPILQATVETSTAKPDPGELVGRIEVSHVSFRYKADGPVILRDVTMHASPGEFVALVGPSGSGKSTLLRLLLGFEPPESGAVYFDEQDLRLVDLTAVRSQTGVVLQSSRLLAGDIFENIVGSSPMTLAEAWEAAEMAGLADDIRQMPMGMNTMVLEGGSTLSGGQRQRMLIARALVRRPRIVLFDEATSALDNRTQEIVSRSLENMKATRIVIAHRLSTVRHADRIIVMEAGQVVQSGSYDELATAPGLFSRMIARQLM